MIIIMVLIARFLWLIFLLRSPESSTQSRRFLSLSLDGLAQLQAFLMQPQAVRLRHTHFRVQYRGRPAQTGATVRAVLLLLLLLFGVGMP